MLEAGKLGAAIDESLALSSTLNFYFATDSPPKWEYINQGMCQRPKAHHANHRQVITRILCTFVSQTKKSWFETFLGRVCLFVYLVAGERNSFYKIAILKFEKLTQRD